MAKLLALTLAFAALVAFATAHTTIVTTTIDDDDNPISRQRQCSQQIQQQRLNQCRMYLQQGQSPYDDNRRQGQQQQSIQECCEELQNIDEQCQCEAIKQVFRQAQQQQQQQQGRRQSTGPFSSQQTRQLKQKAQMLPNQCNLQTRQCQIGTVMTTITTIDESDDIDNPSFPPFGRRGSRSGSQQCSQSEIQRPVTQCQRYVEQQIQSPWTIMMSTNRRGQEQQGDLLRQCCNELQNLERECQCDAVEEIARRVLRQQQQGGRQYGARQQQGGRRGGQQQQTEIVRRVVQNLPNQCSLDVQQCSIPYEMF